MAPKVRESGYMSDFANEYFADGKVYGKKLGLALGIACSVLQLLEHRRIYVPGEARMQILCSEDFGQLNKWLEEAYTAKEIDELSDLN